MNTRNIDKYHHIKNQLNENHNDIIYQKITLGLETNQDLFIINNLLTDQECDLIINNCQAFHHSLEMEFLSQDRDSKRLLNIDNQMAKIIFNRIKSIDFGTNLQPFGFGAEGQWEISGVNPCFRHSFYEAPSIGFLPHRDSAYIQDADNRSIYTLLIYLNDDFDGGSTSFIKPKSPRKIGQIVSEELLDGFDEIYNVNIQKGSAVIFNHDIIHYGKPVISGTKYIIRSDIIYHRTSKSPEFKTWKNNPYFLQAIEYYREANHQEMLGNIKLSSELYERGLALRQFH
ncbi:hypothetical protein QLL95_gp0387 [Cotonvirus japonicus]|uniref:Fe2OG dioxygenase domain-containing protein n=1 Tax=Cotonvirus japonicus TaxID=2811091 RepID=A0ABM7NUF8_9VIRU|nr:hypothetical protein QLL95_gp0387 [Cotonvirus japonicus]BCS83736.1 hypothetical protein [Cotonvirus japonicus]